MNYTDLQTLAIAYADRASDVEIPVLMPSFFAIVEAKLNRALDVQQMGSTSDTPMVAGQVYYDLPASYNAITDIRIVTTAGVEHSVTYLAPEIINIPAGESRYFYTIVNNQIKLYPVQEAGTTNVLRVYYNSRLTALVAPTGTNWVSTTYPDAYAFGLLVEISSFVKDANAATAWSIRFNEVIEQIINGDGRRWIGPSPQMQVG